MTRPLRLSFENRMKRGSGLEMTHFFNSKQVLMENVSFQDPIILFRLGEIYIKNNLKGD